MWSLLRLSLVAVVLPAACRGAPAPPDGAAAAPEGGARPAPFRIAMIAKSSTNPSFLAARIGAEDRARQLSPKVGRPIEIDWLTPPREDGAVQAARLAQAVGEGADAVLLSCSDEAAVTPAIDAAVARGVPVMTFDSDAPGSRRFAWAGVDDLKAGRAIFAELARVLSPGAKVAVLAGNPSAPNLRRRVDGVLEEAKRHPRIEIVGVFFHVETPEAASATVLRVGARHPEIAGWAMVGGWALYTKTLLRDLTARAEKGWRLPVRLVSINALPPQLAYLERGIAPVLLAQPTYLWGAVGVETIVGRSLLGIPAPGTIPMELVRVTAENLGPWTRQLREWGFMDAPEEYLRLK